MGLDARDRRAARRVRRLGARRTTPSCSSPRSLNGLTLAALYFLVASGFTLVFGLMRNVNLAHGSLYLLGAYVGYVVGDASGSWLLAVAAGFLSAALVGLLLQVLGVPLHAGGGSAPDAGDHRPVDRAGRHHAVDLGRRDLHLRPARADLRLHAAAVGEALSRPTALVLLSTSRRHRRRAVVVPEPHARGHDDPRGRRRPRHAGAPRASTCSACSRSPSRSARGWRASPAWSAAPRCRSRRARTRATCWPRWWW